MQQLWLQKLTWHEPLPPNIVEPWILFLKALPAIESLQIPRTVLIKDPTFIALYGFADSSEKAYGAVVFLLVTSNDNINTSRLLCSKSRVCPLKALTIPRLELQACLLLSKLITKVLYALKLEVNAVRLFTDSTIALSWIQTAPHLLKTFAANRVSQIQQLTKCASWSHVPSSENPADCL